MVYCTTMTQGLKGETLSLIQYQMLWLHHAAALLPTFLKPLQIRYQGPSDEGIRPRRWYPREDTPAHPTKDSSIFSSSRILILLSCKPYLLVPS